MAAHAGPRATVIVLLLAWFTFPSDRRTPRHRMGPLLPAQYRHGTRLDGLAALGGVPSR